MSHSSFVYHSTKDKDFEKVNRLSSENRARSFIIKNGKTFIKEDKPLGKGASGEAWLFKEPQTSEKMVIKSLLVSKSFFNENIIDIKNEQKAIKIMFGDNYGDVLGDTEDSKSVVKGQYSEFFIVRLLMPFVKGKSFQNFIKKVKRPEEILIWIMEIIKEVEKIRKELNIIHGDPSGNNSLISKGKVHLIDLGESLIIEKSISEEILIKALKKEVLNFCSLLHYVAFTFQQEHPSLKVLLDEIISNVFDDKINNISEVYLILNQAVGTYKKIEESSVFEFKSYNENSELLLNILPKVTKYGFFDSPADLPLVENQLELDNSLAKSLNLCSKVACNPTLRKAFLLLLLGIILVAGVKEIAHRGITLSRL